MAAPKTYDPGFVVVNFLGNLMSGFADGVFIAVAMEAPRFTKVVGADGDVARVRSRNGSGSATLTLLQTSASNDVLSALADQDEMFGTAVGPLMIKDLGGSTLFMAEHAWISKRSDPEFGKDLSNREWVIDFGKAEGVQGGATILLA